MFYYQADLECVVNLLYECLERSISEIGIRWIDEKRKQLDVEGSTKTLFTAFSAVPRYTGKQDLHLMPADIQKAQAIRPGWFLDNWSVDQAARTLLILVFSHKNSVTYSHTLTQIFNSADVGELVALYQSLPLFPDPENYRALSAEGVRSNMKVVFNAVALNNPYPADYFEDHAWNQMVLKAAFIDSPLSLIWGLDRRANAELANMCVNYAHERWAAQRPVSPELWRLVGSFADLKILGDLEKVLTSSNLLEQKAAALACSQCSLPKAQELLAHQPNLKLAIEKGSLTWDSFCQELLTV